MRTLWTIISVLALANLLAVVGFIGWLGMSDRLSADRVDRVRAVFAPTNAQEAAETTAAETEQELANAEAEENARIGEMPMTADERTQTLSELEEIAKMRVARAEGEAQRMRDALALSWEELRRERAKFERDREAFEQMREELVRTEGAEQFKKTVALYESVGADAATNMLREIINGSVDTRVENMRAVAGYLNAMKPRTAAQIIKQFEASDPVMAADLLERIRAYGVNAEATTGTNTDARPNTTADLGSNAPVIP